MADLADRLSAALAGRYAIQRELGQGGMATVFLGRDLRHHHRAVAIKVLHPELAAAVGPERFLREIEIAAGLSHPHILPLHESGAADGLLFYVMPYAEGESLRRRLDREKQLSIADAVRIAREVADALDFAHRRGVVHRDIKPENILLQERHAVVADFGIARAVAAAGGEKLTGTGVVIGTPAYMSPEQAAGSAELDARSDQYSVGCVLYEMLAGQPPFTGATAQSLVHQHLNVPPRPVTDLRPAVPPHIVQALQRALAKVAADRFDTAAEFAEAIALVAGTEASTEAATVTIARPRRRVRKGLLIGTIAGILATVALLGFMRLRDWFGGPARADENALAILAFQNLHDPEDPERLGAIVQELAIADLSELGSLKVFSSQRLHDVARQVGRGAREGPGSVALRVAARAGARTLLTGTLSRLGETWILTGQLVDVAKGTVITSSRVNGADLYTMIDDLTRRIRDDLRIRIADQSAVSLPVRQKTSPSLEAFRFFVRGSARLNAWDFRGAIEDLEQAVSIDSTFTQAEYRLAIANWWQKDDLDAARDHLSRILARGQGATRKDRLMAEAALALVSSCYALAERRFEEIAREYADEKEAWYGLGETWFHGRGGLVQARDAFSRALALDPEFTLASMHLAHIEEQEGRPDSARAGLDRLLDTPRVSPLVFALRVLVDVRAGDAERARASLAAALKKQPTGAARRDVCLAVALEQTFLDVDEAWANALRAHDFDPGRKDPAVYAALAQVARERNDYAEAERWILRGLAHAPNDRRLVEEFGHVYGIQGRHREVIARARDAIGRDPAKARNWRRLWARAAAAVGDSAEAATAIDQALSLEPDAYARRDTEVEIAWTSIEYGNNLERAEGLARRALGEVPDCDSPGPHFTLGWSLLLQNELTAAERTFRSGLALSGSHPGLQNGLLETLARAGRHGEQLELGRRMALDTTIVDRSQPLSHWISAAVMLEDRTELDSALSTAAHYPAGGMRGWQAFWVGWSYGTLGDVQKAIPRIREARSSLPSGLDQLASLTLARGFETVGRLADAEHWLRESPAANQANVDAMDVLVDVLIQRNRLEEAGRLAERCAARSPRHRHLPIVVTIRSGRLAEADALVESALPRLQSNSLRRMLLANVATVHVRLGDLARARALARRAAAFGSDGRAPGGELLLRGLLPLAEGRCAEAESAFARCRSMGVSLPWATYYVALSRALAGDYDSAERELREQIAAKPAYYHYYSLLSALLSERGRPAEAIPFAERAVAMDSSRSSLTQLAWALVAGGGNTARGEALARRAQMVPGRSPNIPNEAHRFTPSLEQTLGVAAYLRGDHARAVRLLEEAARLRPDRPSIRQDLEKARRALVAAR